ncbi:hypothetical protein [Streptomyces flaveus]|uniref:hypothetical protein n=1 Tax=Streptomyces flaveus TaxID=66370 RepID=UPI0033297545
MFEIRVICEPADTDHVVAALDRTFNAGTVTVYPGRDGGRNRLYLRADHRSTPESWPTPEQAYANAPSINSEIGWTARTLATFECFTELDREFYLRKAALLDRIALLDEPDTSGDATMTADAAALYLLDIDQPGVICDPRTYVRQQYAHWAKNH